MRDVKRRGRYREEETKFIMEYHGLEDKNLSNRLLWKPNTNPSMDEAENV